MVGGAVEFLMPVSLETTIAARAKTAKRATAVGASAFSWRSMATRHALLSERVERPADHFLRLVIVVFNGQLASFPIVKYNAILGGNNHARYLLQVKAAMGRPVPILISSSSLLRFAKDWNDSPVSRSPR